MNSIYLIAFLLVATLGLAKTEPNVCGCLVYVFKDGASHALVAQVLSFVIPDFAQQSKECNDNTTNSCKSVCNERVSHLTNDMDLEKQPKGDLNIHESFGQFVCDKFGYDIENETLGVFSYMHCNQIISEHGVNEIEEQTRTVFTGLVSKQSITCKNHRFITQSKESSSTTVGRITVTNVTSKPHETTVASTKHH